MQSKEEDKCYSKQFWHTGTVIEVHHISLLLTKKYAEIDVLLLAILKKNRNKILAIATNSFPLLMLSESETAQGNESTSNQLEHRTTDKW